jgi:hypothetical protein
MNYFDGANPAASIRSEEASVALGATVLVASAITLSPRTMFMSKLLQTLQFPGKRFFDAFKSQMHLAALEIPFVLLSAEPLASTPARVGVPASLPTATLPAVASADSQYPSERTRYAATVQQLAMPVTVIQAFTASAGTAGEALLQLGVAAAFDGTQAISCPAALYCTTCCFCELSSVPFVQACTP